LCWSHKWEKKVIPVSTAYNQKSKAIVPFNYLKSRNAENAGSKSGETLIKRESWKEITKIWVTLMKKE
jgi:hypothetical protein